MRGLKQARWAQTPPTPSVSSPAYLEGREAKACGPASGTKVQGSGREAKERSSSYHSPCACCHRWGLRGYHCPLPTRRASETWPERSPHPLPTPGQLTGCGGARRGLARVWMMPLKATMSHTMTWLTTTAPGTCKETRVRPSG